MADKSNIAKSSSGKSAKGIPVSKIPTSGRDSGTHSRSSSVSNLTTASDVASEAGDPTTLSTHGFKLEDRVYVNGSKPGCIKFLGKAEFAPGIWAGILLDDPVGKNDGSVAGVKYFTCEPMRGIFARPQKLTRTLVPGSGMGDTMGSTTNLKGIGASMGSISSLKGATGTVGLRSAGSTMGSSASLRGAGLTTPTNNKTAVGSVSSPGSATRGVCSKLRLGERVTVSSTTGNKTGILRFVGDTDFAKGEWGGIELDEPVGKNDGSVAGKRYFTCPMKYGLFSPMHKISRAGGTSTPRAPSVRGSPLTRSASRDSISSSISNCSKSSRVKLGITSLSSSQKSRPTGMGIMTTSRALEEALKEKEQHIEQLLKEHDLGRAEVAKITSHCEEVEAKCAELQNQQQQIDDYRKDVDQKMSADKRKLEDLQFQLEEETIVKNDLESQLQQKASILRRLDEFLNTDLDSKFMNVREILEGKENLSEVINIQDNDANQKLKEKISELESCISKITEEKNNSIKQLENAQSSHKESEKKREEELFTLHNTVQEKDDIISNLKSELTLQLEKLTTVIADNQSFAEQLTSQADAEKGRTEEVIKEFGEKVTELTEKLKLESNKVDELGNQIKDKETQIASLQEQIKLQSHQFLDLQNQNQSLNQSFEEKTSEVTQHLTLQHSLEDQIAALKLQIETEIPEKEKKILDLVKQIEKLTTSIQEKEEELIQKSAEVTNFQVKLRELSESQEELKIKLTQAEERASLSSKDATEKVSALEQEIHNLQTEKEDMENKLNSEVLKIKSEQESVTEKFRASTEELLNKEKEIAAVTETLHLKNNEFSELDKQFKTLENSIQVLNDDKIQALNNLSLKTEEFINLQSEYDKLSEEIVKMKDDILNVKTELSTETEKLKQKEEQCTKLEAEILKIKEVNEVVVKENEVTAGTLKCKEESVASLEKQLSEAKHELEIKQAEENKNMKEIEKLESLRKETEEECAQLKAKLELSEQKVEMLNKDSSEHVMTLQNELSHLKEEHIKTKTALEQKIAEMSKDRERMLCDLAKQKEIVSEKENAIANLESQVKSKENDLSQQINQIEKLKQDLNLLEKQKAEVEDALQKQLLETKEELNSSFQEKEQEVSVLQKEYEKTRNSLNEIKSLLAQKEEEISKFENDMKTKDVDMSNLSSELKILQQNIEGISKEKEEIQEKLQKQILVTKEGLMDELKQREQAVENGLSKIAEYEKIIENNKMEISARENDIGLLQKTVSEKESQFNELSKMIEASQAQLKQLNENNANNVKLLETKEIFITNFKEELEKNLKEKEEKLKSEISTLEQTLVGKEEINKQKDEIILKLTSHNQEQQSQIDSLKKSLEENKALQEKVHLTSENVNKEIATKLSDLEEKYKKLLDDKEKLANEELKARNEKKNLEEVNDALVREKRLKEEAVKDRETKLAALQAEVNRMQTEFTNHKQDLLQKLNVSVAEKEAALELKNQMDLQHSVLEELQNELQKSEEKCKTLESQNKNLTSSATECAKLSTRIQECEQIIKEKIDRILEFEGKIQVADELLSNSQNIVLVKENECVSLKNQVQSLKEELESNERMKSSLKSLEEENKLLKLKAEINPSPTEKLSSSIVTTDQIDSEERDSLLSQINFLNSIIVDMKNKNEELQREIEFRDNPFQESDLNLNEVKKIPPRLFCDICDMFDLHDTDDCPKQESYIDDGEIPNLVPQGVRKFEERPYCNNCEVFGHWTLDCKEEEEY